jgi:predicted nucleic acid-binding protein
MPLGSTTRSFEPTSIVTSTRTLRLVTWSTEDRGLIDTSVAVDIHDLDPASFPAEIAISSLTLGELVTGPHAATNELARVRRLSHLRFVEANIEALPFDLECAGAYGAIYMAVMRQGRKPRGRRAIDLMIAATALAHDLPIYTRNAKDLRGVERLIEIVEVH